MGWGGGHLRAEGELQQQGAAAGQARRVGAHPGANEQRKRRVEQQRPDEQLPQQRVADALTQQLWGRRGVRRREAVAPQGVARPRPEQGGVMQPEHRRQQRREPAREEPALCPRSLAPRRGHQHAVPERGASTRRRVEDEQQGQARQEQPDREPLGGPAPPPPPCAGVRHPP